MRLMTASRVLAGVAALVLAGSAAQAQTDARWRAWTGCWMPLASDAALPRIGTVCVLPTDRPSAVEVVSIVGGKIVERNRIDADGVPHDVSRDGCTGTQTATWSPGGTRVTLAEEIVCPGTGPRLGKGVMSFNQRYEWLDVRGISAGGTSGVAVARYQITGDTAGLPAEVLPALALRGAASNAAVLAASAPLTLADIADVSTRVDSGVAATWLMERTRDVKLTLDGKQLAALADQGVPPAVIDVLVALAHPGVFALNPATRDAEFRPQTARGGGAVTGPYDMRYRSYCGMYWSPFYDPWFGDCYGSYGYYGYRGYYGYYSPYYNGYRYGWGYNYPYYGQYYPGQQPIVVVNRPSDNQPSSTHGRVIKGRGYTSGGSSGGSSGGTTSTTSSGTGGSSGGTGSTAGSSSGSAGGGRTAVKKP